MPATSLKLHDEPEPRAAMSARRREFVAQALEARERMVVTGMGFDADAVHAYLRARIAGRAIPGPQETAWRS
ncbi:MAG: hypothetical protein FIA96_05145 [Betaproteobacteria bacterium]|nr:hypothetical protein [Betaproteobacteria bacterium]